MLYKIEMITDYKQIYDYYNKVKNTVPYWFEADYDIWKQSFADDTDYDGEKMFKELVTYAAYSECRIVGFVQVGISDYVYNENGEKDHSIKGGIIRNIYWDKEHSCGEQLVSLADDFFKEKSAERLFAFFHAFGMTCNAGHGKLYCKLPYIEKVLIENGYVKEHENVYYKRKLTNEPVFLNENVSVEYGEVSEKGLCEFKINADGKYVGAGALVYLPQGELCYLKWIYVEGGEQGKGYASAALSCIFKELFRKGIRRIDTDTADSNIIAQRLYEKTGFENMGYSRSYIKKCKR